VKEKNEHFEEKNDAITAIMIKRKRKRKKERTFKRKKETMMWPVYFVFVFLSFFLYGVENSSSV